MTDINELIRDHALLVSVHIKSWAGASLDHAASRAAAEASGAEGAGAFRTVKNLMFKNDRNLKAVNSAANALRVQHNVMTLSWDSGKSPFRMLASDQFMEYTAKIGKCKKEYDDALEKFLDSYLVDASAARRALNIGDGPDAFRLYPTLDALKTKFGVEVSFEPIPEGRSFRNIPRSAVDALKAKHETRVSARYTQGLNLAVGSLCEQVTHLRESLQIEPDGGGAQRWKDSSVKDIPKNAKLVAAFLFTESEHDEALRSLCVRVAKYYGAFTKDQLKVIRAGDCEARINLLDATTQFEVALEEYKTSHTE